MGELMDLIYDGTGLDGFAMDWIDLGWLFI